MNGVFALGLLVVAYTLTVNKRRKSEIRSLNDQLQKSNRDIADLELRITKLIKKYER